MPGVGFRFYSGALRLDIAVCFECADWIFCCDSTWVGEGFDGAAPELAQFVQRLFPQDLHLDLRGTARQKQGAIAERKRLRR